MSETQNSFSELIQNFIVLQNNAFLIMQKISESVTSDADSLSFELSDINGNAITYNLPSYKYMQSYMQRIDTTLQTMLGLNDTGESIVRNPDGTYSKIYQAKISKEPNIIETVNSPLYFRIKPNWFFENFLNPLLYITIDIANYVEQNAKLIRTRRIILTTEDTDKITLFNETYKGRNDININELLSFLNNKGMTYIDDEETRDLPLSILRYQGIFDVIDIKDVKTTSARGVVGMQRRYYLNKLSYSDNLSTVNNNLTLAIGNQFIVGETIYEITSVDTNTNSVSLKRLNGFDTIKIGADILSLYSDTYASKQAEIPIGFNERQIIFFKSINDSNNILSRDWSNGIAFYTNELHIITTSGEQTLSEYYQKNVADYSKILLGSATENTIPAVYGETPNIPTIAKENFNVIRVNEHLFDTKELESIRKKGRDKVKLSAEISQLEKSIDEKKQILGNTNFKTEGERRAVKNELDSLIREKTSRSSLYASIVAELVAISTENPTALEKPKFRIRGFYDIPAAIYNAKTGSQEIIQFEYAYRYIKTDGVTNKAEQFSFNGANNQVRRGTFTPWVFVKSQVRKKYYNNELGIYKWDIENIEDPEIENINQIDIPISKGETVEFKIRSISEAGWPINPIMSEWSSTIQKEFPIELLQTDESQIILSNAEAESIRVKFEETLNTQSLDLHLSTAVQTGDKYWPHNADTINSGFFNNTGLILSLYDKLKEQDILIKTLQDNLEKTKPILNVKIFDENNKIVNITNGATANFFAGYYTDEIAALSENEQKGAIITKQYVIEISNTEGSILELVSRFPGGMSELLPDSRNYSGAYGTISPDTYDYNIKRKYDMVPICNMSISSDEVKNGQKIRSAVLQSSQLLSQYMYVRYKDIGLVNDLYVDLEESNRYMIPINGIGESLPWVWDLNTIPANGLPNGNGAVSTFSVHTDCPILNTDNEWRTKTVDTELDTYLKPIVSYASNGITGPLKTTAFRHAANFNKESFEINGNKQLSFINYIPSPQSGTAERLDEIYMYPDKLGFYQHDRYLIGSDTVGAYLFVGPASINQLLVNGTDFRATKEIEAKESAAIQIPVYFQYRMTDYYGESLNSGIIGGYKSANAVTPKNISYEKRIGLDLYIMDEAPFSFDIKVNAKYTKSTVTEKVNVDSTINNQSSIQNINASSLKDL